MTPEPPQISILDARLAEIDSRLRTIQDGLVVEGPAPRDGGSDDAPPLREVSSHEALPPPIEVPEPGSWTAPAPASAASAELAAELRQLSDAHVRLAAAVQELIDSDAAGGRAPQPAAPHAVRVAVGPLPSTEALRAFERALADLPGVQAVELRGYQGSDRAVLDVQLEPPS